MIFSLQMTTATAKNPIPTPQRFPAVIRAATATGTIPNIPTLVSRRRHDDGTTSTMAASKAPDQAARPAKTKLLLTKVRKECPGFFGIVWEIFSKVTLLNTTGIVILTTRYILSNGHFLASNSLKWC